MAMLGCRTDAIPGADSTTEGSDGETTSALTSSGGPDDGVDESGSTTGSPEPEPEPPLLEPWTEVVDEPFDVVLGSVQTVYEPPPSFDYGSFPVAVGVPRGDGAPGTKVILSFSESEDVADAVPVSRTLATTDMGETYAELDGVEVTNASVLADGTLLSVAFVPEWRSGASTATVATWSSTDAGETWVSGEGSFDAGEVIRGLRFHRGMIQIPAGEAAGTILVPFYGLFGDDQTRTIGLAASDDGGATWSRWGTIAPPNALPLTYDETTVAYTGRGELIAVTRAYVDGELGPLLVSRSADDGQTFSEPVPIEIAFDGEPATPRSGVDPGLLLLPNGIMALVGGRPDNWIAFSGDGGHLWHGGRITYVNSSMNHPFHGSSGYQGLASISSHRTFLVGDNCANSWGCPDTDTGWTVDGEYRIWRRLVDAMPLDPGRVDLATAAIRGSIAVETDLVAEDAALESLSPLDGSLAPGSAVRGAGSFVIDLGVPLQVTRLAVAGATGTSPAEIRLFDGTGWIDPGIMTSAGGDQVLRAFVPPAPRPVQRIEVVTGPDGGLAEIELYTATNSFENEALDAPPRAATESSMARVISVDAHDSQQALRLHDTSTMAMGRVAFELDPADPVARLRVRADALPGAYLFGLSDEDGSLLHLGIDAEGRVQQYDAIIDAWEEIAAPGTVDPFEWHELELGAEGLRVNGAVLEVGRLRAGDPRLVYVTSTGTAPVGVDLLIDDLRLGHP